jgi:hypothetical protein
MHAGFNHPIQDEVGRRAMLPGQEDARKVLRRLGNRGQPIDPANDLIAERVLVSAPGAFISLMLFQWRRPRRWRNVARPIDTSSVPAGNRIQKSSNDPTGSSLSPPDQPANDRTGCSALAKSVLKLLNSIAYNPKL